MTTPTLTTEALIERYATDAASVSGEEKATDLDSFIAQVETAASNLGDVRITGYEDLEIAVTLLNEARHSTDAAERATFLRRADGHLENLWEMADEYRDML